MADTTIRQLEAEEKLDTMYTLSTYAFRPSPPLADREEWATGSKIREQWTYLALFEDGRPVAGAASTPMTQQVRSAIYGLGGIIAVATDPAARRKGYSRRVLSALLATVRDQGRPLSALYPFRESFYERLGYVTFPLARIARFSPLALLPLAKQDLPGRVERMLLADGRALYRDYMEHMQARTHGMALFELLDTGPGRRNQPWLAVARAGDEVLGMMAYSLVGEEVTDFLMRAVQFYYNSSLGRYLLLQWIAHHADQASRVEMRLPAYEWPETWLADLHIKTESAERAPMGRVLDVAGIGGLHTGPGRLAVQVSDPICPWNEGTWQFETVDGRLQVSRLDSRRRASHANCALPIQALTALVYGTHDPGDFAFRGWGQPPSDVQATMRTMFPRLVPHIHEYF